MGPHSKYNQVNTVSDELMFFTLFKTRPFGSQTNSPTFDGLFFLNVFCLFCSFAGYCEERDQADSCRIEVHPREGCGTPGPEG